MYLMELFHIFFLGSIAFLGIKAKSEGFIEESEKIDLRRELDKITQELLTDNPLYHSYVFNSGVGNRERLLVDWIRQEPDFPVGEVVVSWQSTKNIGRIHLLGREVSSVTLITTAAQLSSNRTAQFQQHSISFEANVTSTSMFTRWNPSTSEPEVVVVVAVDTVTADIIFYRVVDGKLERIKEWSRYKKVNYISADNVNGRNQLIVVDKGSPASIDVVDVQFIPDSDKLDFRLVQSFQVSGDCPLAVMCRAGRQHYLVLPLTQRLTVYRLHSGHYQLHKELPLPLVSQVICFNVALQTFLAINGESAHFLRLTESGEIISEFMPGSVSEWLVLPVSSYRSDVLLLSKAANLTKAYVWAGANRGFDAVDIPQCDSCLDGEWRGAVSVPFQHQDCLLIPRVQRSSSLVLVGTSLRSYSPVLDKLTATFDNMKKHQDLWRQIKSELAREEERLQYVVKRDSSNEITGKWTIERLVAPRLRLSSIVQPQKETNVPVEAAESTEGPAEGPMQLEALERAVETVVVEGKNVIKAVEEREKKAWGLDGFRGKVNFKNKLIVDNLTVSQLNHAPMEHLLQNTFRKDRPEPIQHSVIVEMLEAEEIVVNRINNFTKDNLKFADGPVEIRSNVTFEQPLTVEGDVLLEDGGKVNGVDLSEEVCPGGNPCSVFPMVNLDEDEVRNGDLINKIDKKQRAPSDRVWSKTISGANLTVVKINGVDWRTLAENVVYKDAYQNISGTVVVRGRVSSAPGIWADSFQYLYNSPVRTADPRDSSPEISDEETSSSENSPDFTDKEDTIDDLLSASTLIVSELEVAGTVSCEESEWGEEAADVVLTDTNPIVIQGVKTFTGPVSVTNNAQVEGTVGGVVVADLFTRSSDQTFYGPTTLHGNITVENMTLTSLWNGKNVSDVMKDGCKNNYGSEVTAELINVLDTFNGVPVSDLVFSGENETTNVENVDVDNVYVTKDIEVDGTVCGYNLDDFSERRLSLQKEQNITGKVVIKNANITAGLEVKKLNGVPMSYFVKDADDSDIEQTLHLSELHVDGDIVTDEGVNGFNISDVAVDAVWLDDNNDVEGPLTFQDDVEFVILESQGICNDAICDHWLDFSNVVFKDNKSVTFTGYKTFVNVLNISEDLTIQEINNRKAEDILTKTTNQEIAGDLIVDGDVRVVEELTVVGLLNDYNISEMGHRCSLSLSGDTITCKGNAEFKENVVAELFNTSGKMNKVEFDSFVKSVVRTDQPQQIKGFKRFTGNSVTVESLEDVDMMNGESWIKFLSYAVSTEGYDQVDHPVTFTEPLSVSRLSVDYQVAADTVNSVNISAWKTDAIYINESHPLLRGIRLASARSGGNVSVMEYGGLNLEHDVIRLHSASSLPSLRVESVTVEEDWECPDLVNGQYLPLVERNTLKTSGDQTVRSDLIVGDLVVDGNMSTEALVNERQIKDVVTLASDQTLHGKYMFECVEAQGNICSSEMISGINWTSWHETGVVKDGRDQVMLGGWRVRGSVTIHGPVRGDGRLADVDLRQLTDNITRDILDVHAHMKSNLTEACEEANTQLASARAQHTKLQYLDITQVLHVPSGPSLVTYFKDNDEYFLTVSENSCTTNIYKWNKSSGTFASMHREIFGNALKKFISLNVGQSTYVLTESSETPLNCEYSGKNLWIFMKDHFKHVSNVNFFNGDLFQGEENMLYIVNSSGMFKYELIFDSSEGRAFFRSAQHRWNISAEVPREWSSATQHEWMNTVYTNSNCSGPVVGVAVDPDSQFVAVATTEPAQVQRQADYIKVYRRNGRLFDKLPAQGVNQLQWLSVPGQTWLVALQNHSTINLYELQGPLVGFQLQITAPADAVSVDTVALPLSSKVNLQPFIILRSSVDVKIVRAFVQGDPYLGKDLTCEFEQALKRVPRK